ncbi:DNA uptake protein [Bernardetia litoralis DSM 6794]|uniref:DNA uptake protein n=1 Tax=Bernardetia litoralis (strain ATCC 23117 / DSM 6794 / NBRC 15988 / NCIMB 1366 / Fx l1 / Sio-4) TaxID=880071 RepID=I4AL75_BERLS|nr:DNA uptake protein [Bernardetia litoralis]AFM04710.1 DNA uptake protein [Bernardetia litoralis DSM 6794]
MTTKKEKGVLLLEEVLESLESSKLPLFNSIQKLNRIGKLLNEEKLTIWTEVQLGNILFTIPIQNWLDSYAENEKENNKESKKDLKEKFEKLEEIGIELASIFTSEELSVKSIESGGGFNNIGFIEDKYNDFIKSKRGNDGTFYKSNLSNHLSIIKAIAYKKASSYHKKYAYETLPESNFEILKANVEDVLFDIDPELAEKLMLAFKSVSSDKPEEWSQALTSCRRFFEKLADNLFPATDEKLNGRSLSKENYINRLWAYMDKSISSKSNKDLAKKHVDLLGLYLQSTYKLSNKGVHSDITRIESIKTVMHIYLVCADLLDYLDKDKFIDKKPNIYSATLDELEVVGNISRKIAKEIIKLRVNKSKITEEDLKKIPGVGIKTLKQFLSNISLEKK